MFQDDQDHNNAPLHSSPHHTAEKPRYPRSYQRGSLPSAPGPPQHAPREAAETPWKAPKTPHYIHAQPAPSRAACAAGAPPDFGELVTVDAAQEHTATVIWLHGLGDTGHTWSAVASWLGMTWCRFLFPTAPAQPVGAAPPTGGGGGGGGGGGYAMPSWFDYNSLDTPDVDEDPATLQRSVEHLLRLVDREARAGVPPSRVVLAGAPRRPQTCLIDLGVLDL
jgi:hypothetical protein